MWSFDIQISAEDDEALGLSEPAGFHLPNRGARSALGERRHRGWWRPGPAVRVPGAPAAATWQASKPTRRCEVGALMAARSEDHSVPSGQGWRPPVVLAARVPSPTRPRIEITPDEAQYEQLCHDLSLLRRLGMATTNTTAIIEAVHESAERAGKMAQQSKKSAGRRATATRPGNRR